MKYLSQIMRDRYFEDQDELHDMVTASSWRRSTRRNAHRESSSKKPRSQNKPRGFCYFLQVVIIFQFFGNPIISRSVLSEMN